MITSKQYDELCRLIDSYRDAVDALHTAAAQDKVSAAYDFSDAHKELHEFVLNLVDFDGISKEADAQAGWIPWGGGECPVSFGVAVDIKFLDGFRAEYLSESLDWAACGEPSAIVAYRIVGPRTNTN